MFPASAHRPAAQAGERTFALAVPSAETEEIAPQLAFFQRLLAMRQK